jgi:hypothetical protein
MPSFQITLTFTTCAARKQVVFICVEYFSLIFNDGPLALDPCESAAQVFKCGVENSVNGMANLIATGAASGDIEAKVEFKFVFSHSLSHILS